MAHRFLVFVLVFLLGTPLMAATWTVRPGQNLQRVIDDASEDDEIILSPGKHRGHIFLGEKRLTIRSTNPEDPATVEATILKGRGPLVTVHEFAGGSHVLSGLTLSRGRARSGGGVLVQRGSITLRSCRILMNQATGKSQDEGFGGGVYASYGRVELENCTVRGNSAWGGGGVAADGDARLTIKNCTISENQATYRGGGVYLPSGANRDLISDTTFTENRAEGAGGGIYCDYSASRTSSPTRLLEQCRLIRNISGSAGGGIALEAHEVDSTPSHLELSGCDISENSALWGGGVYNDAGGLYARWGQYRVFFLNCLVGRNLAQESGGGLYLYHADSDFSHCTIAGNVAESTAPGVYCDGSSLKFSSCILFHAGPDVVGNPLYFVRYTRSGNHYLGHGNTEADPRFVNPMEGDFRLLPDSPCIDAGRRTEVSNDACSPTGMGGARSDMGAYGGPRNCGWPESVSPSTPTATPTSTTTPSHAPTPTPTRTPVADMNGDNRVDANDILRLLQGWREMGEPTPGLDIVQDGVMDFLDLAVFQQSWEQSTAPSTEGNER